MGAGIDRRRDLLGGHCLQSVCGMLKDRASGIGHRQGGWIIENCILMERERERERLLLVVT